MVVHTPNPISGQKMESLIEKLIEENKKIFNHKETNILPSMMKKFSMTYGEAIEPIKLKTFVERYDTTFNVYWKMLEDASGYRVELYKHISGVWYKLTEFDADRNNGYASITDLVGDGYVFRVVAEDRSGNIIARSAGIVIGYNTAD
jgi:hypothetical protein